MAREQHIPESFLAFQSKTYLPIARARRHLDGASAPPTLAVGEMAVVAAAAAVAAVVGCVYIHTEGSAAWVATFGWKVGRHSLSGAWKPSSLKTSLLALDAAVLEKGPYLSYSRIDSGNSENVGPLSMVAGTTSAGSGWEP